MSGVSKRLRKEGSRSEGPSSSDALFSQLKVLMKRDFHAHLEHVSQPDIGQFDALKSKVLRGLKETHVRPEFETNEFVYFSCYPTLKGLSQAVDFRPLEPVMRFSFAKDESIPADMKVRFARPNYFEFASVRSEVYIDGVQLFLKGQTKRPVAYHVHWSGPYQIAYYANFQVQSFIKNDDEPQRQFTYKDAEAFYLDWLWQMLNWLDEIKRACGVTHFFESLQDHAKLEATVKALFELAPVGEATSKEPVPLSSLSKTLYLHYPCINNRLYIGQTISENVLLFLKRVRPVKPDVTGINSDIVIRLNKQLKQVASAIESGSLDLFIKAINAICSVNKVPYRRSLLWGDHLTFDLVVNKIDCYYFIDSLRAFVTPLLHAIILKADDIIEYILNKFKPNLELGIYRVGFDHLHCYERKISESALIVAMAYYPEKVPLLLTHGAKCRSLYYDGLTVVDAQENFFHHYSTSQAELLEKAGLINTKQFNTFPLKIAQTLSGLVNWFLEYPVTFYTVKREEQWGLFANVPFATNGPLLCHLFQLNRLGYDKKSGNMIELWCALSKAELTKLVKKIIEMALFEYQVVWHKIFNDFDQSADFSIIGSADIYAEKKHLMLPLINCPYEFDVTLDSDLGMHISDVKPIAVDDLNTMSQWRERLSFLDEDAKESFLKARYDERYQTVSASFDPETHSLLNSYVQSALQLLWFYDGIKPLAWISQFNNPSFEGFNILVGRDMPMAAKLNSKTDACAGPGGHCNYRFFDDARIKQMILLSDSKEMPGYSVHLHDDEFGLFGQLSNEWSKGVVIERSQSNQVLLYPVAPRHYLPSFIPDPEEFSMKMRSFRHPMEPSFSIGTQSFYISGQISSFEATLKNYLEPVLSEYFGKKIRLFSQELYYKIDFNEDEDGDDFSCSMRLSLYDGESEKSLMIDALLAYTFMFHGSDISKVIEVVQVELDRLFGWQFSGMKNAQSGKLIEETKPLVVLEATDLSSPVVLRTEFKDVVYQVLGVSSSTPLNISQLVWKVNESEWNFGFEMLEENPPFKQDLLIGDDEHPNLVLLNNALFQAVYLENEAQFIRAKLLSYINLQGMQFYSEEFYDKTADSYLSYREYHPGSEPVLNPVREKSDQAPFIEIEDSFYFKSQEWFNWYLLGFESAVSNHPTLIHSGANQYLFFIPQAENDYFQFHSLELPFKPQFEKGARPQWRERLNQAAFVAKNETFLNRFSRLEDVFISDTPSDLKENAVVIDALANIQKRVNQFMTFYNEHKTDTHHTKLRSEQCPTPNP